MCACVCGQLFLPTITAMLVPEVGVVSTGEAVIIMALGCCAQSVTKYIYTCTCSRTRKGMFHSELTSTD